MLLFVWCLQRESQMERERRSLAEDRESCKVKPTGEQKSFSDPESLFLAKVELLFHNSMFTEVLDGISLTVHHLRLKAKSKDVILD